MKEFCLVPRAWVKKEKKVYNKNPDLITPHNNKKPDLDPLLSVYVKPINREYVNSMLTLFNNNGSVQWNERGDMMPPFSKINIIELLRKFSLGSGSKLDEDILPDVKLLLSVADIQKGYIRNKTIRSQLSQEGGGKVIRMKRKQREIRTKRNKTGKSWLPW